MTRPASPFSHGKVNGPAANSPLRERHHSSSSSRASQTKMQHFSHNGASNGGSAGGMMAGQYMPFGYPHAPPGFGQAPPHSGSPAPSLHHTGLHGQHAPSSYLPNGTSNHSGNAVGGGRNVEGSGPYWQQQVRFAAMSAENSGPHHHARVDYLSKRQNNHQQQTGGSAGTPSSSSGHSGGHEKTLSSALSVVDPVTGVPSPVSAARKAAANGVHPRPEPDKDAIVDEALDAATQSNGTVDQEGQNWDELDLGGMGITNVSLEVFNYIFLTALYIPHNALTYLPSSIGALTQLKRLDASSNKLSSLPPELGGLSSLRELFLFDNRLVTLPAELGSLFQLEFIGVEGNINLHHELRELIERGGTAGLISYLRDNAPMPPAPPEREWYSLDVDPPNQAEDAPPPEQFCVLNYNVLCEKYATAQIYGYTPSWALSWEYRKEQILRDLQKYSCDIFCLQEVDGEQYENFFLPHMLDQGFEGIYFAKSRARTMTGEERRSVDGCATFYRSSMFTLIEQQLVEFNQVAMRRPDFKKTEDMFNRVMTRDNICTFGLLESRASGARLIVANVHLEWRAELKDVKLVQVGMLMDELEAVGNRFAKLSPRMNLAPGYPTAPAYSDGTKIPTLVCGDFNSVAGSGVHDFMSKGVATHDHADFMSHLYGQYTSEGVSHRYALRSAHADIGELPFTNYTPGFKECIDYVWYTTNALDVTAVLGPLDMDWMKGVVGFPNAHFPSDHIPLCAEFRFRPPPS